MQGQLKLGNNKILRSCNIVVGGGGVVQDERPA